MNELVKTLIERLKQTLAFLEVRTAHASDQYLEAVLSRPHLSQCCELLSGALGQPLKDFDQPASFDPKVQKAIKLLGGIRIEQCLFFAKGEDRQVAYAALWPWASDASRVTIKVGLLTIS